MINSLLFFNWNFTKTAQWFVNSGDKTIVLISYVPSVLFKQFVWIISVQETEGLKIGRSSLVA